MGITSRASTTTNVDAGELFTISYVTVLIGLAITSMETCVTKATWADIKHEILIKWAKK